MITLYAKKRALSNKESGLKNKINLKKLMKESLNKMRKYLKEKLPESDRSTRTVLTDSYVD